jgi:hypothetical protein
VGGANRVAVSRRVGAAPVLDGSGNLRRKEMGRRIGYGIVETETCLWFMVHRRMWVLDLDTCCPHRWCACMHNGQSSKRLERYGNCTIHAANEWSHGVALGSSVVENRTHTRILRCWRMIVVNGLQRE